MSTREPTLIELLAEAADCYGMPIGTGERLREAAGRIREEMRLAGPHNHQPDCTCRSAILERINGGPSPDPGTKGEAVPRGHCNRCDYCGWELKLMTGLGCVAGSCSMRPLPVRRDTCAGCGAPYLNRPTPETATGMRPGKRCCYVEGHASPHLWSPRMEGWWKTEISRCPYVEPQPPTPENK